MEEAISRSLREASEAPEAYTLGYEERARQWMKERSASSHASFLIPYLRPGLQLLDCGCGPGAITLDLAELVTPGQVVGIDIEASQIEAARGDSRDRGLENVRFQVGDVYALPFPDRQFDVVFAHALLMHLRDPLAALKEMRRVLKPGGIAAVSDPDYGGWIYAPSTPLLDELNRLLVRVLQHNGASPYYARHQRGLLLQAGFGRSEGQVFTMAYGSEGATRVPAEVMEYYARAPAFVEAAVGQGWTDHATLDAMCAEMRAWAERPDAFYALLFCAAVGWVES